jgi:hypothetical protein
MDENDWLFTDFSDRFAPITKMNLLHHLRMFQVLVDNLVQQIYFDCGGDVPVLKTVHSKGRWMNT